MLPTVHYIRGMRVAFNSDGVSVSWPSGVGDGTDRILSYIRNGPELERKAALVDEFVVASRGVLNVLGRLLVCEPPDLSGCTPTGSYHEAIRDITMSSAVSNLEDALAKAEGAKL